MDILPISDDEARRRFLRGRDFFVEKVIQCASQEGHPLTPAEKDYLCGIGTVDEKVFLKLQQAVDQESSSDKFCERVSELVKTAMERDIANDPRAKETYDARFADLGNVDALFWTIIHAGVRRKQATAIGTMLLVATGLVVIGVIYVLVTILLNWGKR